MGTQLQHLVRNTNTMIAPAPSAGREAGVAHPRQEAHDLRPVTPPAPAPLPKAHRQAEREAPARQAGHHAVALAGLQLLLGYEWLASGVDKLLYTSFPTASGELLRGLVQGGRLPGFFGAFLRMLVLPNSVAFGYLVEWGETLAGLGLITGGLVTLLAPVARRRLASSAEAARWLTRGQRAIEWLAAGAALGAGLMGLTFYLLDGAPSQWFMPSIAFGGALDSGLMLAVGSAVLLADDVAGRLFRRGHAATQEIEVDAGRRTGKPGGSASRLRRPAFHRHLTDTQRAS
jgi:uncharacterized membrane protein YphA (DoxX/SURF4 family)